MNYTQYAGKAMISQPMRGKTDQEIVETREKALGVLRDKGYMVVNTLFTNDAKGPLWFLGEALKAMSQCNAVYFCKGWENARGCKIEHEAAVEYGLHIMYEE